jgi:methyl-accepting chemotaxis protein
MLSNMKLSVKLIGGFIIVAVITLIVGFVGWYGVSRISAHLTEVGVVRLPSIQALLIINQAQTEVDSAENALLTVELDAESRQAQYNRIDGAFKRADDAWKIYEPLPQTDEEKEVWGKFVPAWDKWAKDDAEFIRLSKEFDAGKSEDTHKAMIQQALVTNGISFSAAESLLDKIVQINETVADNEKKASASDASMITILAISGMLAGTVIAVLLGIFLSISITKPMLSAVNGLNEGAQQVAAASEQLSASSQQLAEGNSEQASSIEETSSTMEESASMVQQNSENTKQAAMLAGQTKAAADKGNGEMQDMMASMGEIKRSSDQISKIIKVIDEIAFQTNILALNAAVEAARAGDAGMGFAVVAEEVRNLAQRSAQAAKDTAAIIETNIELSEKGVNVAKKVGESLSEITVQAKKVNELMDEIAAASQEQTQGIGQINKAISQMEKVTQMSAASAEECASSSEELSAQALNMKEIVQQLVRLVNGRSEQDEFMQNSVNAGYPAYHTNPAVHQTAAIYHPAAIQPAKNLHNMKAIHSGNRNTAFSSAANHNPDVNRAERKAYVVNPDEIIPLDDDKKDF